MDTPGGLQDFKQIIATNTDELHQVGERIHDEHFDPEEVRHNEKAGTLDIPFRRIFHDGPRRMVKNRLIYRVDEVDVLRCSLRFLNVITYRLDDRTRIGSLSLNRFLWDEKRGLLTLQCCEDCGFSIHMSELHAEYREIEYRGKARITNGFFWDCNSSEVYD